MFFKNYLGINRNSKKPSAYAASAKTARNSAVPYKLALIAWALLFCASLPLGFRLILSFSLLRQCRVRTLRSGQFFNAEPAKGGVHRWLALPWRLG